MRRLKHIKMRKLAPNEDVDEDMDQHWDFIIKLRSCFVVDFVAACLQAKVRERVFVKLSEGTAAVHTHLVGLPLAKVRERVFVKLSEGIAAVRTHLVGLLLRLSKGLCTG